jgi:nicotinate-nucleotide adenylyltransferase
MLNIALFGTSADPPTAAHQYVIRWLSHQFDWVAVWASDNPFKSHQTPLEHRAAMLKLLIEDIQPPRYNISYDSSLSHPRAIATVETAQQHWPEATFTLVMGSDLVPQLPRWHRIEDLLKQVQVLVIQRPGYPVAEADLMRVRGLGGQVAIVDPASPNISSTAYRQAGRTEVLTPPIEAYIHREHLYACQDAAPKSRPIR